MTAFTVRGQETCRCPESRMKQAFLMSVLPSKTGLVRIVNGRVLIRPMGSTVTFTANLLRLLAIATDRRHDAFLSKSTRYGIISIAGDSPRRTRFHSHSIINKDVTMLIRKKYLPIFVLDAMLCALWKTCL